MSRDSKVPTMVANTISWHSFQTHTDELLSELYTTSKFSDVTLISNDKTHYKVHRFILSACSSVLKTIFDDDSNTSPYIFLRGITNGELEPVLQYMYFGEANVLQDKMDAFFAVAKDLDVKGLDNDNSKNTDENLQVNSFDMPLESKMIISDTQFEATEELNTIDIKEEVLETEDAIGHDENEDTNSIATKDEDEDPFDTCEMDNQLKDKETYNCNHCDKTYGTRSGLWTHIQVKHTGKKHPCPHCNYRATQKTSLREHIKTQHQGVRYTCHLCDYVATQKTNLMTHIKILHDGLRYPCKHCDFKAAGHSSLKKHLKSKHQIIKEETE